jgi:hypothetical protein
MKFEASRDYANTIRQQRRGYRVAAHATQRSAIENEVDR